MTLRTGFGPHGVQDPPCYERLRVGFAYGSITGLLVGSCMYSFIEYNKADNARFSQKLLRVGKKTGSLSLVFGMFLLAGCAIKCT